MTEPEHAADMAPGTQDPQQARVRPLADDTAVPHRIFLGIGGAVAALAAIYWFTAYEDAGTVLLAVAAVLATWCGIYFWLRRRHAATAATGATVATAAVRDQPTPEPPPTPAEDAGSSVWPFVIGTGAAATAVGFAIGLWILLPGAATVVLGTIGFVRERAGGRP